MRYAASTAVAAARERFPGRTISEADGDLWLVRLEGVPRALHLTHQGNLDALAVDDRISTGRMPCGPDDPLLRRAQRLSDAMHDWWGGRPPPLVYRTGTNPSARSMAFTATVTWLAATSRPLREATALHAHLVVQHHFTVPDHWLR